MRSRSRLLLALSLLLIARAATAEEARARPIVYLQPLGQELPEADVALVERALTAFYTVEVRKLVRIDLPQVAWYPPRRRWRAEKILRVLADRKPADGARILGLTAADISTTKGKIEDWGVLGLGDLDGPAGVISTLRAHKGAKRELHARERLAKVAVHEIGHTLGLPHCPTRGCLMEDAEGTVKKTDTEYDLCERCRKLLRDNGHAATEHPDIPWGKPDTI